MAKGSNIAEAAMAFIEKTGNKEKAVQTLYEENFLLRKKNRRLARDMEKIKESSPDEKLVLGDGEVKMSKKDFDLFAKYKELGTPEDLQKTIEEHSSLKESAVKAGKEQGLRTAARILDFNPDVFVKLIGDLECEIEESGDKKEVFIKDGDSRKPAGKYAEEHWDAFMPSLKAEEGTRAILKQHPGEVASKGRKEVTEKDLQEDQEQRLEFSPF